MHMVPETMAEMAWWALGIKLATFVMACVHRIHTLTLSEAITDTQCQPPFPLCPHTWQGVQKQGYMEISPVWGEESNHHYSILPWSNGLLVYAG